ncbi:TonB-dependent receptor [Sphingomonas histidinilytica]|uniref:TonB-dependent receptor n=1 Tax=Rhizorhabdus histidinilytica TaxID=439228 RepID=UPI001ADCC5F8|nr:TonB-dependent receptor [Rhizorhabdus histidinilytica]MBO9375570.1 TonB-dependent receptor [Rhizorhabdus histidinilytica]
MKVGLRLGLFGVAAVGALIVAEPASAQDQALEYHIEEQKLGDALRAVGRESGRAIMFRSEIVEGKRSPRLDGTYTAEEAIEHLLAGTELVATPRDGGILIRGRSESAHAAVSGRTADDSDIIVTGSRIRGAPASSPVTVQTREEIKDAGVTNLGDFARTLTQNYSGGQNPGVSSNQGFRNTNLNNSSALNLRGLGPDATLTLINGHRVAYDGLSQGVDISAIPLAAIERVEIVADGASALYGTDAVGGVANVILRRDFVGLVTSARIGASTDGGNEQQQYGAVTGSRWASGGIMAAIDYSRSTAILARNREYTSALDDTATLVPRQSQFSLVLAGRQKLTDAIALELDGQYNIRRSANQSPTLTSSDVFTNGLYAKPKLTSFTVTPTLRFQLPSGWQGSLSGTYGQSETDITSLTFSLGKQTRSTRLIYTNDVSAIEATAEGPLFRIAGGDVRLAVGGGYRSATLDVNVARTPTGGLTTTTEDVSGSRDVAFGYGELSVPLVGPENKLPFVDSLRLNAAVRYENYRNIGDVAAPKIGLIYKPHHDVAIKASWGRSFKAPTLYQSYQVRTGNIVPGASLVGFPAGQAVLAVSGGNDSLRPERAKTWTVAVEFEPSFITGFRVEASYFDIRFKNRVVSPITDTLNAFNDPSNGDLARLNPTAQQIADEIARLPLGATNFTGLPENEIVIGGILDGSLQNAAQQTVRGVDLALRYRLEFTPEESLQLSASGSYQMSEQQLASGKPIVQLTGLVFNPPHWRGRVGGTYQRSNVSFSAFGSYIGGTLDNRLQPHVRVTSFTTLDTIARIRTNASRGVFRGVDATIAVTNLLNEKPAFVRKALAVDLPYDSTNYSVAGRVISLTVTKAW